MMRRANIQLIATLLTGLAAALTCGSASAAVWRWACQGELGGQRILFDRDGLYIAGGKASAGKPGIVTMQSIEEAIAAVKRSGGFTEFGPEDVNRGLESPFEFSLTEDGKQKKVVFTEQSSKQISHQHRLVFCGSRDEDIDLYRKVYRYERAGEPARDITMQCMEYQLSTRGGRKGCD
jgi:hypothetical protein